MPIYYGPNEITSIFDGSTEIGEVYYGGNLVFSSYKETNLGKIVFYASGDPEYGDEYQNNYYCTAYAYKIRDHGRYYLKIAGYGNQTGYWGAKGDHSDDHTKLFPTNINLGTQTSQVNFQVQCYYNTYTPDHSYVYKQEDAYVARNGTLYLPLGIENVYRSYDQWDNHQVLIPLTA